jgi:hypothetical protein
MAKAKQTKTVTKKKAPAKKEAPHGYLLPIFHSVAVAMGTPYMG